MSWRQYDNIVDDLKNIAFKTTLAPFFRKINSSKILNKSDTLPRRIIICGCPRSGTTLMNELLRCYTDVYVSNREEYALRFPYLFVKNKYIATKHPLDFVNLSKLINTFNKPFIIYLLRDPRDVIISNHYKNKGQYLINYPTWDAAIKAYENFDYDNLILIRYEDLIRNPSLIQEQLAKKINLDIRSNFNKFHKQAVQKHQDIKSLGGVRPIDPKNTGKYMKPEHFSRIREQLQQHPEMSTYLIKYGYEKDREWEDHFLTAR